MRNIYKKDIMMGLQACLYTAVKMMISFHL